MILRPGGTVAVLLPCAGRYLSETSYKRQRRFSPNSFLFVSAPPGFIWGVEIL
jgi:hypothetical protein